MADFDLSMRLTADGSEAADGVQLVDSRVRELNESSKESDNQNRKTAASAKELAKQQRATADAINAVTRATNPALGSQKALEAALRKAERAYIDGKISINAYQRAQEIAARASFNVTNSARTQQQGIRQLGLQFNDLGTQIAAGISPMTAFIQQTGQIGYAMSLMEGRAKSVGNFLAGPWGAVILVATSILGGLVTKLLDGKKASEDLSEAQKLHQMSTEELTKAIDDQNKALGKSLQTEEQARQAALDSANAKLQETIRRREHINAILEEQRALLGLQRQQAGGAGQRGELQALAATETQNRVAQLEANLAANQAALVAAQRGVALAQVPIAQAAAKARTDPSARIQEDYRKALAAATEEFVNHGRDLKKLNAALDAAEREQQRANKALQDSNRKPPKVSLGDQVSALLGKDVLAAAQSHVGQTERSPSLQEFLRGQSIDPEKEAWCAAFINAVLASKGIQGTGSNAARSFLGFGSATSEPQKGDIVVLRSGSSPSGAHVGFFAGESGGRVQVTGGNQGGGRVTTTSFARSDVLGFRSLPTAADQFKDEQQAMKQAEADAKKLADLGEQAATKLGELAQRAIPTSTSAQAKAQLEEIDRIMADVEKRKPPNLAELRKNAEAARDAIKDGVLKPFNDFLQAQQQSLEVQRLADAGLKDEAETLQEVYRQQEAMGKELLPEQVRQIYAAVKARNAEAEAARKAQEQQRQYLKELDQYKDVFRSLFSGNVQDIKSFPKRLLGVATEAKGDQLFNAIFGDAFKSAQDKATGADKVKQSNLAMSKTTDKAAAAVLKLANAANKAAGAVGGVEGPEGQANAIASGIDQSPLGSVLTKLGKGIGLSDKTITDISNIVGKGVSGAATGGIVAGFGKLISSKFSTTGAQIGGAIGSFLPIPGGDIIGSIIGGTIGALIKKPKFSTGTFSLSSSGQLSGGIRDSRGDTAAGGGLIGSISDAVNQIIGQLGGTLTNAPNITAGTFQNHFRVSTTGYQGRLDFSGASARGLHNFENAEDAVRFAVGYILSNADISGVSAAVKRVFAQTKDIDQALKDALGVQQLEQLLGGVTGQLDKVFSDFEHQAKERVRLATQYGLDLTKVEELNGKERAKLLDDILKQRVGDLQNFLDDMRFGSLFEGTATDRRAALLGQIATVRGKADAGEEGAASQLADLERQLLDLSRNAFGTAGPEYAADRAAAEADAQRIIDEETARAREAQERAIAQLNAANTTNTQLETTNNLLSGILTTLQGGGAAAGGSGLGGFFTGLAGSVNRTTPLAA